MNGLNSFWTITGLLIGTGILFWAKARLYRAYTIVEGQGGLLYHEGKLLRQLEPGRHTIWGRHYSLSLVELRKSVLSVAGQEVLTKDRVSLRMSFDVTWQLLDPIKAVREVTDHTSHLYHLAQLALRTVVGEKEAEILLQERTEIGRGLTQQMQTAAEAIGISIHGVELKDVMFPGDLKRAFNQVLKARQEGQAALERARGESAALRNLANASRVMENHPALMNLRTLQILEGAGEKGHTLIMGLPGGFLPLSHNGLAGQKNSTGK